MKQGTPAKNSKKPREKSSVRDDGVKADVAAARRRAKERRKDRRRSIPLGNLLFVAATIVVSVSMIAGIKKRYTEYYVFRDQVVERRAQLKALDKQYAAAKSRLAMLESQKGRAQLLVERGYVHPNERILLFPGAPQRKPESDAAQSEDRAVDADTPKPAETTAAKPGISRWTSFWRTVRGLPGEAKPAASSASASNF